jgi:hypothetical protein
MDVGHYSLCADLGTECKRVAIVLKVEIVSYWKEFDVGNIDAIGLERCKQLCIVGSGDSWIFGEFRSGNRYPWGVGKQAHCRATGFGGELDKLGEGGLSNR